jgi:ribosome-binding protein aMBF1 (putative translation factor)
LNNSSSIKEARLSKGLSIEHLAAKLKMSPLIIEKIENDEDLPDRFKSYE